LKIGKNNIKAKGAIILFFLHVYGKILYFLIVTFIIIIALVFIVIIATLTSKIKIEFVKFELLATDGEGIKFISKEEAIKKSKNKTNNKSKKESKRNLKNELPENSKAVISIFIFGILKIISVDLYKINFSKIKNKKIVKTINKNVKERMKKIDLKKDIKKKIKKANSSLKLISNIDLKIEKLKLNLEIGTENSAITAFAIAVISSIFGIMLNKYMSKENRFLVLPIYQNKNLARLNLSGTFKINSGKFIRKILENRFKNMAKSKAQARKVIA
jgi:hypothetical protein